MTDRVLETLQTLLAIAHDAGGVVMRAYEEGCDHTLKPDASPVTEADEAAEALICRRLRAEFPDVLIVAEEMCAKAPPPMVGERFFVVDPLDGTKEFLTRNGEFTVNIALVEAGAPVCGVVYAPAVERIYVGAVGRGAWGGRLAVDADPSLAALGPIRIRARPAAGLVAIASRSHPDAETDAFLARLPIAERRTAGSSLKFCLVAEGVADVYPRFGPTMEWDVAAGHAVLAAAGGAVTTPDGGVFAYGKAADGYRNGPFVAWGARG